MSLLLCNFYFLLFSVPFLFSFVGCGLLSKNKSTFLLVLPLVWNFTVGGKQEQVKHVYGTMGYI